MERVRVLNEDKISLELKSNLSELNTLKKRLDEFAKEFGISPKCLFEIHLAMEEIVANIISHGCVENSDQRIRITLSCENQTVVIRIEDRGYPTLRIVCGCLRPSLLGDNGHPP